MRVALSWSGGKDAAWALQCLHADPDAQISVLLVTLSERGGVVMHGIDPELVRAQARALALPLVEVTLPDPCPNEVYAERMREACARLVAAGVEAVAFGDLHLADVRSYREASLAGTGLMPLFPLWGRDTRELAQEMLAGGLRATLCCVDTEQLPAEFAGRDFDAALLAALPSGVDPCGENGEFHSFVHGLPAFAAPVRFERGACESDGRFVWQRLRAPAD